MNNICLFFIIILTVFSNFCFSQQELTLEDAVLKRWTSLYPEQLKDINWNPEQDFFSYQHTDSTIYICDIDNVLKDTILLEQINTSLDVEDQMLKVPSITWTSAHSFRFKNNHKYYIYNTKRGDKANFLFNLNKEASHVEFNKQNDQCAYTISNNLYVVNMDNNHIKITNEENENIIFGQAVHRYEFGIYKGTFWSNDGDKLAFYRKDESMVTDYPLLDISSRVGHAEIIKYPIFILGQHAKYRDLPWTEDHISMDGITISEIEKETDEEEKNHH